MVFAVISAVAPVVRGDCDLDGAVTFGDIPPMIDQLLNGTFLAQADCNADGGVAVSYTHLTLPTTPYV